MGNHELTRFQCSAGKRFRTWFVHGAVFFVSRFTGPESCKFGSWWNMTFPYVGHTNGFAPFRAAVHRVDEAGLEGRG